jgi:hypothetical protein
MKDEYLSSRGLRCCSLFVRHEIYSPFFVSIDMLLRRIIYYANMNQDSRKDVHEWKIHGKDGSTASYYSSEL